MRSVPQAAPAGAALGQEELYYEHPSAAHEQKCLGVAQLLAGQGWGPRVPHVTTQSLPRLLAKLSVVAASLHGPAVCSALGLGTQCKKR